jgi:hypothetical protein
MGYQYFVAAYPASPTATPASSHWNPLIERQYFQALIDRAEVIGIEHPFYMASEKYNLDWLLETIPSHWSMMLTLLPTFMMAAKTNPYLGLASTREQDRSLAVKIMEQAAAYVAQLSQAFGRQIVKAIHFHSLPKNEAAGFRGHQEAFKKSLIEIKTLDWQGAALNLEHCDAYIPGQPAEKGFLSLEDEIEALDEIGGFGLVLNWARSAIEGRSTATPLAQLKLAKAANLLKGFFFSGCTDDPRNAYGAWKDTHMPPGDGCLLNRLGSRGILRH